MGTKKLIADLFIFCCESQFMAKLHKTLLYLINQLGWILITFIDCHVKTRLDFRYFCYFGEVKKKKIR